MMGIAKPEFESTDLEITPDAFAILKTLAIIGLPSTYF